MKQTPKEDHDLLYESLLQLNNVEECRRFMEDLCTVTELKAMRQGIIRTFSSIREPAAPPSAG